MQTKFPKRVRNNHTQTVTSADVTSMKTTLMPHNETVTTHKPGTLKKKGGYVIPGLAVLMFSVDTAQCKRHIETPYYFLFRYIFHDLLHY